MAVFTLIGDILSFLGGFGKRGMRDFPDDVKYRKFSLANLKSNQFFELEI
jgi:hypothetical protein